MPTPTQLPLAQRILAPAFAAQDADLAAGGGRLTRTGFARIVAEQIVRESGAIAELCNKTDKKKGTP